MGLLNKDPAKAAAEAQAKAETKAEAAARRAEQEFWASPQGQARKARQDGRTWFQAIQPVSVTNQATGAYVTAFRPSELGRTTTTDRSGFLEAIESEGWKLEHVGYVFQPVSTVSRDKLLSSGQTETISGKVIGIYLFRVEGAHETPSIPPPPPL